MLIPSKDKEEGAQLKKAKFMPVYKVEVHRKQNFLNYQGKKKGVFFKIMVSLPKFVPLLRSLFEKDKI